MNKTKYILIFIFLYIACGIVYKYMDVSVDKTPDYVAPDISTEDPSVTVPIDITPSSTPGTISDFLLDPFDIKMLNSTSINGRVWYSKWNNGKARTVKSGVRDFYDNDFIGRGIGSVSIDGKGVATLSGESPRMYIYDAQKQKKWNNVEVTIYAKRVSETGQKASQGIVIGARSEHQDASEENACAGRTYYARLLYDGRSVFQKEVVHSGAYSINKPEESYKTTWATSDGTMPKNIWIGLKYVVHTNADGKAVNLKMYRDLTDGENGGTWEKIAEYTDVGDWAQGDSSIDVLKKCGSSADFVLLNPGTSVFVRNDSISSAKYKWFSIREIK